MWVKVAGLGLNVTSVPLACVGRADDRQRRLGVAMLEADEVFDAVAPDAHLHPFRQRVHHRGADAVQAAGDLVGVLVELAAGVQPGQHHFGRGDAFLGVDVGRDAAPVVAHGDAAVAVQHQLDRVAKPACASSTALSMISNAMWCRPDPSSVSPIYMPGRRRTASRPSRTEIDAAS